MAGSGRGALIAHAVLLAGLALVVFPIYVAFVASSLTLRDVLDAPMTLIPGPHLITNYRETLTTGTMGTSGQGVPHDGEQPGHGAAPLRLARSRSLCSRPMPWCFFAFRCAGCVFGRSL